MTLVGLDKEGEKHALVPPERFSQDLAEYLSTIHRATLASLEKQPSKTGSGWQLHYVKLGLGLEGAVKVAGVRTLAAAPRLNLYFSNKKYGRGS